MVIIIILFIHNFLGLFIVSQLKEVALHITSVLVINACVSINSSSLDIAMIPALSFHSLQDTWRLRGVCVQGQQVNL